MRRDIDIGLLRAFVAVVERRSVTGAAALLNLTQAAVSQQLKRLEELFGTELFERHHKRLVLKPNGERLVAHAQRLIALNDEVWGAMSAPAYAGEVRLGVPHDIVGPYMPPILRRFDKAWPRVRVALKCTNTPLLRELMSQGALDLTLTTEQRCGHGGEVLLEDDLVWAGAPNGAAHRRDPLPVSLGDENCEFRASVLKALADTGRDWRPGVRGLRHGAAARLPRSRLGGGPVPAPLDPRLSDRGGGPAPAAAAEVPHQHVPAAGAAERDRRGAGAAHRPGVRHPFPPPVGTRAGRPLPAQADAVGGLKHSIACP